MVASTVVIEVVLRVYSLVARWESKMDIGLVAPTVALMVVVMDRMKVVWKALFGVAEMVDSKA